MEIIEKTEAKNMTKRLLDAAEHLFARQGIRGTSLREITEQAGGNIAAVNYYFRSKEALVQAVYERSFRPLNEERLRLLDLAESEAGGNPLQLESILHAFFEPMVRAWRENKNFILLLGRFQHEPDKKLAGSFQNYMEKQSTVSSLPPKRHFPMSPRQISSFGFIFSLVVWCTLCSTAKTCNCSTKGKTSSMFQTSSSPGLSPLAQRGFADTYLRTKQFLDAPGYQI